jgi:hypothetical protein
MQNVFENESATVTELTEAYVDIEKLISNLEAERKNKVDALVSIQQLEITGAKMDRKKYDEIKNLITDIDYKI